MRKPQRRPVSAPFNTPTRRRVNIQTPSEDKTESLFEVVQKALGIVGGLAGITFIIGFLIVNTYLYTYGIPSTNLLSTRYISAGLLYALLLFVAFFAALQYYKTRAAIMAFVLPLLLYLIVFEVVKSITSPNTSFPHFQFVFYAFLTLWGLYVCLTAIIILEIFSWRLLSDEQIYERLASRLSSAGELGSLGGLALNLAIAILWAIVRKFFDKSSIGSFVYRITPTFIFGLFFVSILFYSVGCYGYIPPNIGGGAPLKVQFVGDKDSVGTLNELVAMETISRTVTLDLVDETSSDYIVFASDTQGHRHPVILQKDLVKGVILPEARDFSSTFTTPITSTQVMTPTILPATSVTPVQTGTP